MHIIKDKVSVIINCYNREKYLKTAIDSIYDQSYKNWEIIFLNNNSNDNSKNIAKSYDEKLKYFETDSTINLGRARELAFSLGNGEFLALCDSDDYWHPEKLKKQIDISQKNKFSFVFSDSYCIDDKNNIKRNFIKENLDGLNKIMTRELLLKSGGFFHMGSILMKRSLYENAGGFNPNYIINHDTELWFRLNQITNLVFMSDKLAYYRIHDSNISIRNNSKGLVNEIMHCKNNIMLLNRELGKRENSEKSTLFGSLRLLDYLYFILLNDKEIFLKRIFRYFINVIKVQPRIIFIWLFQKFKRLR